MAGAPWPPEVAAGGRSFSLAFSLAVAFRRGGPEAPSAGAIELAGAGVSEAGASLGALRRLRRLRRSFCTLSFGGEGSEAAGPEVGPAASAALPPSFLRRFFFVAAGSCHGAMERSG